MLGEFLQGCFADTAGGTDKNGDKTWRKKGGDAGIGGLDMCEGDHGVV